MGNEGLFCIDAKAAEDQRPRIGCGRALSVEIHFLAGEILQALDLGPDKDMQLRGEEIEQVRDPTLDVWYLNLVLFERVGIDDRRIDTAQVEQRIQVFRGTPGDDRQDMQIRPVINDARHLRREAEGRPLKQAAGETDRPGVDLLFFGRMRWGALRRADALRLRIQSGRLKRQNDRRQHSEQ